MIRLQKIRRLGRKSLKLHLLGTMSRMQLMNIFFLAFAVLWFVKRHPSYSWAGQDILVKLLFLHAFREVSVCDIIFIVILLTWHIFRLAFAVKVVQSDCDVVICDGNLFNADSFLYSRLLLYFFAARLSMTFSGSSFHH